MKLVAIVATILILTALGFANAQMAPSSAPSPGAAAAPASAATLPPVKPIQKRYLLSHSTPVYAQPNTGSRVIEHVGAKTHVSVSGITGDWLVIRLHRGGVGYIPATAAE
jgi:hypothetical protein